MPIKATSTSTRPSTNVAYHIDDFSNSFDVISYMENNYRTTGKLLATSFDNSDVLTNVWTEWWDSMESLNEFLADTVLNQGLIERNLHREANNIQTTYTTEEVSIDAVPVGVFS
jgi:hypothetical protein